MVKANEELTELHARWTHIPSKYDYEIKHRPGNQSEDAAGLSQKPLQRTALLAYQGAEISESEENQTSLKEDFALAIPEGSSPFAGTEKDGELVLLHPKKNPVSCDIWLDPTTL
jgi:hypothetical protein